MYNSLTSQLRKELWWTLHAVRILSVKLVKYSYVITHQKRTLKHPMLAIQQLLKNYYVSFFLVQRLVMINSLTQATTKQALGRIFIIIIVKCKKRIRTKIRLWQSYLGPSTWQKMVDQPRHAVILQFSEAMKSNIFQLLSFFSFTLIY